MYQEELDSQVEMFNQYRKQQADVFKALSIPLLDHSIPIRSENLQLRASVSKLTHKLKTSEYKLEECVKALKLIKSLDSTNKTLPPGNEKSDMMVKGIRAGKSTGAAIASEVIERLCL